MKSWLINVVIGIAVVVVGLLLWRSNRLEKERARQIRVAGDSLQAQVDLLTRHALTQDTVFVLKVKQHIVTRDSIRAVVDTFIQHDTVLIAAVGAERAQSDSTLDLATERADSLLSVDSLRVRQLGRAHELLDSALALKTPRHWGLGATLGMGAKGPDLVVGVTIRF